ncbi:Ank domain-containing protein/Ank_2 domain-containing protein [Cephalotus follicularis]|uniref:Ank domain-containing protein/Ank_2 domain-containing protein n=1 Tax=Cephalotus follicularis TaxID=3775 RepID=A0A1Q3CHN0_CEPFO|nr:Ank domain-containing protein/Ank_2 domain-containing protein [Cephalotus follicularis]
MMVSWMTITLPSNCLLPQTSAIVDGHAPTLRFITNHFKEARCFRKRRISISLSQRCSFSERCSKVRSFVVKSNQTTYLQGRQGRWEDPDDGSGSEYEEEGEKEEEDELDYESDWEEGKEASLTAISVDESTSNNYEQDLIKEVEQLLGPEEREILLQNATPNLGKITSAKWKLLHTLALSLQIPLMDKLLENELDIDVVDKDGHTALHKAVIGKKEAVISHLLRKGASPHVKDRDGATPLHYAVQVGAIQTVKLLIKYNVDVNVADNEGWTPLHIAVQSRKREISKFLLINGADKTRRNKNGHTALDLSLCYGKDFKSYELAKLLKVVPAN